MGASLCAVLEIPATYKMAAATVPMTNTVLNKAAREAQCGYKSFSVASNLVRRFFHLVVFLVGSILGDCQKIRAAKPRQGT